MALLMLAGAGSAHAADPDNVQITLEGCRNGGTITLPDGSGKFICPDTAYTTGNLGKGWNELDLVPHRVTLQAGNAAPASQTYTIAVVLDYEDAGKPGYDLISVPALNAGSSTPGTCAASVSPATLPPGGALEIPGLGGIAKSVYRLLTVTQARNTTCVFDFYGRLALGSHLFPGSSLHANAALPVAGDDDKDTSGASTGLAVDLTTAGIGARDVSIPVKEILPQELRKDMQAQADSQVTWSLKKSADPASINFGNVCAAPTDAQSKQVTFRVEWTRGVATGTGVAVITHVYAKNPAARTITVNVTDVIYKGTTQTEVLDTASSGPVDVPAATELLVLTHSATLPASAGTVGGYLNDVATATYTDKVTGLAVPGNTTATASAQIGQGTVKDSFAAIGDSESITGTGLKFSVASPAIGGFVGNPAYVAGTQTVGPVDWGVTGETASRYVDFVKTVYLDARRVTTGTLTDTAVLLAYNPPAPDLPLQGPDFTQVAGPVSVSISSSAEVKLTISKTIPQILDTGERIEVTFTVTRSGDPTYTREVVLTFNAGETAKSDVLTGLVPDTYTVSETKSAFFAAGSNVAQPSGLAPVGDSQKSFALTAGDDGIFQAAECEHSFEFTNAVPTTEGALVKVQKLTNPVLAAGDPDLNWTFTLSGTDLGTCVATRTAAAGAAAVNFVDAQGDPCTLTKEGTYTITETTKGDPWFLASISTSGGTASVPQAKCTFTVDLPEDAGKTFACTFTNVKKGKAKVVKTVKGAAPSGAQAFTFQLREGASATQVGTTLASGTANAANGGVVSFSTWLTPGATYQLCEIVMPGWQTSLGSFVPNSFVPPDGVVANPNVDNSVLCVDFTVSAGETKEFKVDNTPPPGGRALTIGFWKNWASCTSSSTSKKPVLDQTLALAPVIGDTTDGHSTLPGIVVSAYQLGSSLSWPLFGPNYVLVLHGSTASPSKAPDCTAAVRLLDKSTTDTAKKMASDPAFNLAAQLVAAELNYTAGAGKTPAATSAINQAVQLLGKYGFNGKTHGKISAADATTMNNLAKTLDDYNNNR